MTLIVAGHLPNTLFNSGLFVIADSAITSGSTTLLNGFRKIYPLPIKVWKPSFLHETFRGYRDVLFEIEGFVAFSGNTLTSQHYMNAITEHLGALRVTSRKHSIPLTYRLAWLCEENPIFEANTFWDEETFAQADMDGLLTPEFIVETVSHALNAAIRSAREYKLNKEQFQSLLNQILVGFPDPNRASLRQIYHLYRFDMLPQHGLDGVFEVSVVAKRIEYNEVAVLGLQGRYGSQAQAVRSALSPKADTAQAMWKFTMEAIAECHSAGDKSVALPMVWYELDSSTPRLHAVKKYPLQRDQNVETT